MATPVQCRIVGLAIFRRPQREEQHALSYAAEVSGVLMPQPRAARVLANIARKGRELAAFLDYPVMPIALEDRLRSSRLQDVPPGIAVDAERQRFDQLPNHHRKRNALFYIAAHLDDQMKMVGHYNKIANGLDAIPRFMKAPYHGLEELGYGRRLDFTLRRYARKGHIAVDALRTLQRHHVEEWRLVVESRQPAHGLFRSLAKCHLLFILTYLRIAIK